ncbi:CMD domain protein [Martelella alba]|uniref:CMD domain protein n=1 Tax=Martelella alba TaxID=2590451 RepID=A0A506U836_9HYPH|nr:CMD domain protein [Martelella alba]TPW29115.1 CMD domain protein [Martelella alba]
MSVDVIDKVLGSDADLTALRAKREKIRALTQASHDAALKPKDPGNFSYGLRAALAQRMAGLWHADELVVHYRALLAETGEKGLEPLSEPGFIPGSDPRLAAILAHVDLITLEPKQASRANIEKLYAVGLSDKDIVTLASLIAFINYQVLVVAGLKMLRDH